MEENQLGEQGKDGDGNAVVVIYSEREAHPSRRFSNVMVTLDEHIANQILNLYESQFDGSHPKHGQSPIEERFKGRYFGRVLEVLLQKAITSKKKQVDATEELPEIPASAKAESTSNAARLRDRQKQLWFGIVIGALVLGIVGAIVWWMRRRSEE